MPLNTRVSLGIKESNVNQRILDVEKIQQCGELLFYWYKRPMNADKCASSSGLPRDEGGQVRRFSRTSFEGRNWPQCLRAQPPPRETSSPVHVMSQSEI